MFSLTPGAYIDTLEVMSVTGLSALAFISLRKLSPSMPLSIAVCIGLVVAVFMWGGLRMLRKNAALKFMATYESLKTIDSNQSAVDTNAGFDFTQDGEVIDVSE